MFLFIFVFYNAFMEANDSKIKMCINPNWMPFEHVNNQNEYEGILAEYINIFSKRSQLSFKLVKTKTYKESLEYLKNGKCDILSGDILTSDLKKQFLSTKTYFISTRAFVTHKDAPLITDISQLSKELMIGVLENSAAQKTLPKLYPHAKIIPFENIDLGVQGVASKHITTFVTILPSLVYSIQKLGLTNVKIAGYLPSHIELSVIVNKNKPYLVDALNGGIDTLKLEDKKAILDKWAKVEVKKEVKFGFLFEILGVSLILILAIYSKNRTLLKMNNKLSKLHKELELKNDELTILSNTDSLTGIYNRRNIDKFLQEQVELFQRYKTPFSIILIDIDHFKLVNDIYGHDIGDSVLIDFSKIIKKNIRISDKVGRWGGEEFMVVCPHNTKSDAIKLANKLRQIIYKHKFEIIQHKTASFGVAQMEEDEKMKSFFKRVDTYLYKAKTNGRNQIVY